jgi:hypothetical protein
MASAPAIPEIPAVPVDPAVDPAALPVDPNAPPPQSNSVYQNYDPVGAMGGLFAPGYVHGWAPSEKAVADWTAGHHIGRDTVEASRMPGEYMDPTQMTRGDGVYGGPLPVNQSYGDKRGTVDPEALRIWAQGGKYDLDARRNAIAARVAANQAASAAVAARPPPPNIWG